MRVKGNISPRPLDIEAKPGMVGYVCVRLRENIVEFTKTDDEGRIVHGYEYDEYEIVVKYYDGLQHDILSMTALSSLTGAFFSMFTSQSSGMTS